MQMVPDAAYEDLYRTAMEGISMKVAMQCIRKVMRDNKMDDTQKLAYITGVIKAHEDTITKEAP